MALTDLESTRLKIGDKPKLQRELFEVLDADVLAYQLQYRPVVTSPAPQVYKNNTLLTETTQYTVDYANGIVTLVATPTLNDQLIVQYSSVVFSDEEINSVLDAASGSVLLASHNLLYSWAARLAVEAVKESRSGGGGIGAITIDTSVRAREMRATADAYMKQYETFEGTGEAVEYLTEIAWTPAVAEEMLVNRILEGAEAE